MNRLEKYKNKYDLLIKVIKSTKDFSDNEKTNLNELFLDENSKNELLYLIYEKFYDNNNLIDFNIISKSTGLNISVLKEIFSKKAINVQFPIVADEQKPKLVNAKVIMLNENNDFFCFNNKDLKTNFKIIKQVTEQSYIVFFNNDFSGNSFMLSIAAVLFLQKELDRRFIFTGIVDNFGNVRNVSGINEKLSLAEKENKILIYPKYINKLKELECIFSNEIHLPFSISTKNNSMNNSYHIEKEINNYSLKLLFYMYPEIKNYLLNNIGILNNNKEDWEKTLKKLSDNIKKINKFFLNKKIIFHYFLDCPATLAFALGTLGLIKYDFVVYHFKNEYKKIIDSNKINVYDLKHKKNSNIFKTSFIENNNASKNELILCIDTNRDILKDVKKFKNDLPTLYLNIQTINNNWLDVIYELNYFFNKYKENYNKFHFFYSAPVVLYFIFGMIIQEYYDVTIYHKNADSYFEVFSTSEILKYKV